MQILDKTKIIWHFFPMNHTFWLKKICPGVGKYCYRWMKKNFRSSSNMSPSFTIYNHYILLIRGNFWVAIRSSKGRLCQNVNLRWTLVSNRKANIHVNNIQYTTDQIIKVDLKIITLFFFLMHLLANFPAMCLNALKFKWLSWLYFHCFPYK